MIEEEIKSSGRELHPQTPGAWDLGSLCSQQRKKGDLGHFLSL